MTLIIIEKKNTIKPSFILDKCGSTHGFFSIPARFFMDKNQADGKIYNQQKGGNGLPATLMAMDGIETNIFCFPPPHFLLFLIVREKGHTAYIICRMS